MEGSNYRRGLVRRVRLRVGQTLVELSCGRAFLGPTTSSSPPSCATIEQVLSYHKANCVLASANSHNRSTTGSNRSRHLLFQSVTPMHTSRPRPRNPEIRFRVLIIGRANAGKTSILQRICETTESLIIRTRAKGGNQKEVRGQPFVYEFDLIADQVSRLDPSMDVSDNRTSLRLHLNMVPARRAHHR